MLQHVDKQRSPSFQMGVCKTQHDQPNKISPWRRLPRLPSAETCLFPASAAGGLFTTESSTYAKL